MYFSIEEITSLLSSVIGDPRKVRLDMSISATPSGGHAIQGMSAFAIIPHSKTDFTNGLAGRAHRAVASFEVPSIMASVDLN